MKPQDRRARIVKNRAKMQTNKIMDRLTFNPKKHKQKKTKSLRQKLQQKAPPDPRPSSEKTSLRFGSFNLNGLDLETAWAVEQLVDKHGFDVHKHNDNVHIHTDFI